MDQLEQLVRGAVPIRDSDSRTIPPVSGARTMSLAASSRASGAENVVNSTRDSVFCARQCDSTMQGDNRLSSPGRTGTGPDPRTVVPPSRAVKDAGRRSSAPKGNRAPAVVPPRRRSAGCGAGRPGGHRGRDRGRRRYRQCAGGRVLQQRFRRFGGQVRGDVEKCIFSRGAHIVEPVGRHSHREERRIVKPGKGQLDCGFRRCSRRDGRPDGSLLDRRTRCLKKPRGSHDHSKTSCPRDRYIEPVAGIEELDLPRQVVAGRCRHRDQHDRRFLARTRLLSTDRDRQKTRPLAGPRRSPDSQLRSGHALPSSRIRRHFLIPIDAFFSSCLPRSICSAANWIGTRIASPRNVPNASSVASPSMLPLPHWPPAGPQLLFHFINQCLLMLALWSCGRRPCRPSTAANPQGSSRRFGDR